MRNIGAKPAATVIALACSAGLGLAEPVGDRVPLTTLAPLDGLVFEARIVRDEGAGGQTEPLIDRLSFADGQFSSRICERYGFVPGEYWVRGTPDAIRFHAVLHSPTDGTMEWTGTVKADALEGTMSWTRERWYRTIRAEHRIAGQRTGSGPDRGSD